MAGNTQNTQGQQGADAQTGTQKAAGYLGVAASFLGQGLPLVGIAGSLLAGFGEASQKKAWSKYQAKQAKADGLAQLKGAYLEADKIRKAASTVQGQAVSAAAGSGVVVGEGTAGLIEKDIRQRAEEDALMAIYDGQDAYKRSLAQAKAYKINGSSDFKSALWKSSGSLFDAAGLGFGAAGKWLKTYSEGGSGSTDAGVGGK